MIKNTPSNSSPASINYWYKDKKFFIFYLAQLLASVVASWYLVGPLFETTFKNGDRPFYWWTQAILIFGFVLPLWIIQFFSLFAVNNISNVKRILLTLGTYIFGFVNIIALSFAVDQKIKHIFKSKFVEFITKMSIIVLFYVLIQLLVIFFADLAIVLIEYIN